MKNKNGGEECSHQKDGLENSWSVLEVREYDEETVLGLARNAYTNGDAAFDLIPEKSALLVIDMQDEFVKPKWTPFWVPDATKQVPRIKGLIQRCHERNVPVIYTVMSNTHRKLDRPLSGRFMPNNYPELECTNLFMEGNVWHELAPEESDIVIHKCSYGAFYDTPLQAILNGLERDTIVISGTLTNYCCGTTARQGYARGFKVIFGSDITATDDPDMQEPEIKTLRKGFAKIMTCEEILSKLA